MEELKNKLISSINESELSAEAVYFVVKDLYRDIIDAFNEQKLKTQKAEKEEEEQHEF